jgi:hypothetical protein
MRHSITIIYEASHTLGIVARIRSRPPEPFLDSFPASICRRISLSHREATRQVQLSRLPITMQGTTL